MAEDFFELKLDNKQSTNGVWLKWPGHEGEENPAEFLIASDNNEVYQREYFTKYRRKLTVDRHFRDDPVAQRELEIPVLAKSIVLDWRGRVCMERAGEITPYSREACIDALRNIPKFYAWVKEECQNLDNFRRDGERDTSAALKSSSIVGSQVPEPGQ